MTMMKTILAILIATALGHPAVSDNGFYYRLADSAMVLTSYDVIYDPSYYSIAYPNGAVPAGRGVCTDVIIRAYRMFGVDLQKEVHEDMKANFDEYPDNWGLSRPDRNIDHRRVPNLMEFFGRHGETLPITNNPEDYKPGSIVCWNLGGGFLHVGIVSAEKTPDGLRYMIIHNIGRGQVAEDVLFNYEIIGHYRYTKSIYEEE